MSFAHRVRVSGLPAWLDWQRFLGEGAFQVSIAGDRIDAVADLPRPAAADLAARLRGVSLAGAKLVVEISPPLRRADVRAARTVEARRYRAGSPGFTRSDMQLDEEARRSLTPEALAFEIGQRARALGVASVLDACCGAGGNAIGFARAGCTVRAIEYDRGRLAMAVHNARRYGVADRIAFVGGDAGELVPREQADLLFIDPPWENAQDQVRATVSDLPLLARLLSSERPFAHTWIKVPPSFDPSTIPGSRPEAFFGVAPGDAQRVKFVLLYLP